MRGTGRQRHRVSCGRCEHSAATMMQECDGNRQLISVAKSSKAVWVVAHLDQRVAKCDDDITFGEIVPCQPSSRSG